MIDGLLIHLLLHQSTMPAVQFRIPEEFESGFKSLIKLNDEQFDQLKGVLQSTKPGETESALAEALARSLGLTPSEAVTMAVTIISVYRLLFQTNGSVADLSTGLEVAYYTVPSSAGQQLEIRLRERLIDILSLQSNLFYTIKSLALFDESDAVFGESRVITDIRLTFDHHAVKEGYKSGLVIHNLKIGYRQDGEPLHLVVSCHGSDLEQLRAAIDRALEKERAIKEGELGKAILFIDKK